MPLREIIAVDRMWVARVLKRSDDEQKPVPSLADRTSEKLGWKNYLRVGTAPGIGCHIRTYGRNDLSHGNV